MSRPKFEFKPIEVKERPLTRVEQLFGNLKEQYKTQVTALVETGVLELMTDGKSVGYVDIKDKERPLPSYDEFVRILESNYELVEDNFKQGFTNARLDLIGLPLDFLFNRVRDEILKAKKEGRLKSTDGTDLDLNVDEPIFVGEAFENADITGKLIYNSGGVDLKGEDVWVTKSELLEKKPSGYQIRLDEDIADLRQISGKSKKIPGRKLLSSFSPLEYGAMLKIEGESGETVDSQILNFLINLKKGIVIDDHGGNGYGNWLVGNVRKNPDAIPSWSWNRHAGQVSLFGRTDHSVDDAYSCRATVIISEKL